MENKPCGNAPDFLASKLSIGREYTAELLKSERFYAWFSEIKGSGEEITNNLVYEELCRLLFPMLREESQFLTLGNFKEWYASEYGDEAYLYRAEERRVFRDALRQLSKALYGEYSYWKNDYEAFCGESYSPLSPAKPIQFDSTNEDLRYLPEVCGELKPASIRRLLGEELTVEAFRKAGKITDLRHAYEVFKPVFFYCVRGGYRDKPDKHLTFIRLRSVAQDFCTVLYGDKDYWHTEYGEYYKDKPPKEN